MNVPLTTPVPGVERADAKEEEEEEGEEEEEEEEEEDDDIGEAKAPRSYTRPMFWSTVFGGTTITSCWLVQ